jgi:predicted RNA binding protein YcfA (HicA-like mRNA interferase family)
MFSPSKKMACPFRRSGLTQSCLPYDQVASDLGAGLRRGLGKAGFQIKRQHGSHIILRRDVPFAQVVVPDHKELDTGTLRGILRQAGLSPDEFIALI